MPPITARLGLTTPCGVTPGRVVAGLFLASLAMRPQILAIGPLLPFIRDDLGLPAGVAGLLTTIPVLCMGLFAPVGPQARRETRARTRVRPVSAHIVGFGLLRAFSPRSTRPSDDARHRCGYRFGGSDPLDGRVARVPRVPRSAPARTPVGSSQDRRSLQPSPSRLRSTATGVERCRSSRRSRSVARRVAAAPRRRPGAPSA